MMLATAARRAYGMANRHMLPPLFKIVGPKRKTPWVAALILTLCAALVAQLGDIAFAAHSANFAVFLAFFVSVFTEATAAFTALLTALLSFATFLRKSSTASRTFPAASP